MAMRQQLSAVGLYLAIILILYGQKEVLNEDTYKANKAFLEEKKRDKKQNTQVDQWSFTPSQKKSK